MEPIPREAIAELLASANSYPIVTLLGPRQSGKTTLAKLTFPLKPYVNLEALDERQLAKEDPRGFLSRYPEGAILDEIQRAPQLLSYLQVLVDEKKQNGLFILTGSHQLKLQEEISQSLAGRTGILHLYPLSYTELKSQMMEYSVDQQMFYGGYPRIYEHQISPLRFYRDYTQTYIERDLKLLINVKDLDQFQRFLSLCAARVGSLIDYTAISNDLGISRPTIMQWLSALKASYLAVILPPYFENFGKRIIRSPKLYFTDVGLLCYLLGIRDASQLQHHPLRGAIFENYVLMELIKNHVNRGIEPRFYFYRDSAQVEVDILIPKGDKLLAIEVKSSQTFQTDFLKSIIKLQKNSEKMPIQGYVVYTGQQEQEVRGIQVISYEHLENIKV